MTRSTAIYAVNEIKNLISSNTQNHDESLGFTRWFNLSKKKKVELFTLLYLEGFKDIPSNNLELQKRLSLMTNEEYRNIKK